MKSEEATKKLRKFIGRKKISVIDIGLIIDVSKPTLYKKMKEKDFSDSEISILQQKGII